MKIFFNILTVFFTILAQIDEVNPDVIFVNELKKPIKKHHINFPYKKIIHRNSRRYSLEKHLILATIKAESNFNPYAVSEDNAIGLMQVVADKGGQEAWKLAFGDSCCISDFVLYEPEMNIRLGCAYFWCLKNRHFYRIKNNLSKMYCIIAAYNTGPSNVFKSIISDFEIQYEIGSDKFKKLSSGKRYAIRREMAIKKINEISSEKTKNLLLTNLPYEETVIYLKKVLTFMKDYENINN